MYELTSVSIRKKEDKMNWKAAVDAIATFIAIAMGMFVTAWLIMNFTFIFQVTLGGGALILGLLMLYHYYDN